MKRTLVFSLIAFFVAMPSAANLEEGRPPGPWSVPESLLSFQPDFSDLEFRERDVPSEPSLMAGAVRSRDLLAQARLAQARPSGGSGSADLFSFKVPEWLKRVDLGVQVDSDQFTFYLETVQPLYQSAELANAFFIQPRVSIEDGDGSYSVGSGYRQIFFDQVLAGVNVFFDYSDDNDHARVGYGLEVLSQYAEGRLNVYQPFTGVTIASRNATTVTFERALKGVDFEAGGPVPYLPFLKLFGGFAWYDGVATADSHRGKFRAEVFLTRFLRLDAETWSSKGNHFDTHDYRVSFSLRGEFRHPRDILNFFKPTAAPYPKRDLKKMMLHRVVREFNIVTERFAETTSTGTGQTGTVTINLGRGS